jgi:TetR/AcrR family transcriptional regulator, transcriptional repressor for nem operon
VVFLHDDLITEQNVGKAEETRQAIIGKAAVIFNKNGYQRTSMSTLTTVLGLTKGAIYGHFADKDELAVEAFRYNARQMADRLRKEIRPCKGPVDKLRAYAHAFPDIYEEIAVTGGCPILNTATDSDDAHPRLHEEVRKVLVAWEGWLIAMVNSGKEGGVVRADADADLFAANFMALIEGGLLMAKTVGDKKYLEFSVERIDQLIEQMLVSSA